MKRFIVLILAIISLNVWGLDDMLSRKGSLDLETVRPLSCIQDLQLSIGPLGYTVVTPQMVLSDTFASYAPFEVRINDEDTDTIDCSAVNGTVMVTIIDTRNGNSCWSNIRVEDKLPPVINCINDTLPCYEDPFEVDYSIYATATDNCDDDVELWYAFFLNDLGCVDDDFVSYVELRWTAEDDQGITSQCVSRIFFERLDLDDTRFPGDTTVYCPILDSLEVGIPTIDSLPLNAALCDMFAYFLDDTIPGFCTGEYSIRRNWTAMDWCRNEMISQLQVITIRDTVPPVISCSDTIFLSTESSSCSALYEIPPVVAFDECGEDSLITYQIMIPGVGILAVGDTVELDTGYTDIILMATDDCGNTNTCVQVLCVVDDVAPVLFCLPDLTIYVDSMGMAPEMCVEDFDHKNHYFDNCGIDSILIAKMVDFCDSTMSNQFDFCVDFCCADVGEELMVVIKVIDISGNMNFCMINTEVLDTIPPVITRSPPDTSISCTVDYQDTTLTGGGVTAIDNCQGELVIKMIDSVDIDACLEGTVIRTFIACDPSGNADTAVQIITIFNNFVFDSTLIVWAQDTCVENCPPDSLPETIGSQTYVPGDSCGVVMVTYSDVDISDSNDVCLTIERTWMVTTMCGDTVMLDSVQIVTLKNQGNPILSGPPSDTTIIADPDSCGAFVTLPELVATDCSSGLVVTNDCSPTGAIFSMFLPVGVKTVNYMAIDACGNVSTFQTTITIVDNSGPTLICPPDTLVDCGTPTDTSVLGVPVAMDNCDSVMSVTLTFADTIQSGSCPQEMTIFRTWVATDINGNTASCLQTITIQDTLAPIISCPTDVTISCEESTMSSNTGIPTAVDNCDMALPAFVESDSIVGGRCAAEMTIYRTFSIEDDCGNSSACTQVITVIDTTAPMIDCPLDTVVECSDLTDPNVTGMPNVVDNCDPMPNVVFQDSIIPGMGQTFRTIRRTWIVEDQCGNQASCVQEIVVRDTTPPTLICPMDITVGCDTPLVDLSIFGLPDTSDNCTGIILTMDTIYDLDLCNVGTITRIFVAEDSVGNSSMCQQVITVELTDSLTEGDIIWPDSIVNIDACTGIEPDSASTGIPVIDSLNAGCFRVSFSYEDTIIYNCEMGICSTLTRKWTVIDSCQLDTLGNGMYCYTQEIRVIDTMPPMITGIMNDTVYLHPDSMCDAYFTIIADAEDCSGIKSITNNSRFGADTLRNASGRYPRGLTPVTFYAEDSCCNRDTQLIFIVVLDTIPPVISCRDVKKKIVGETGSGMATFCVSELIASAFDNCDSRIEINATFDPNDLSDTCVTYTCDSLVGGMLMRSLTVYLIDGSGNVSTCVSRVTVTDEDMVCSGFIVGGAVNNIHGVGIQATRVEVMNMDMIDMTNSSGLYEFDEIDGGQSYILEATKQDDILNGISTKDIILIQRHLMGKEEFDTPYEYLAADINASNSIQVSDMVRIRQLLLGHISDFRQVPDWYFVYDGYPWMDITQPLKEPDAFSYVIDSLITDMDINFIGVKPGDIDGSAQVTNLKDSETRTNSEIDVVYDLREPGNQIEMSVDIKEASGMLLNLDFALNKAMIDNVQVSGVSENTIDIVWDNVEGWIKVLWVDQYEQSESIKLIIQLSQKLHEVNHFFKNSGDGPISEWVRKDLESFDINISPSEGPTVKSDIEHLVVEQNRPNPFSGTSFIRYQVPVDDRVTFRVWDASGRTIISETFDVLAGAHEIELKSQQLGEGGVYYYQLIGNSGGGTRRMLVIE